MSRNWHLEEGPQNAYGHALQNAVSMAESKLDLDLPLVMVLAYYPPKGAQQEVQTNCSRVEDRSTVLS
jgi:hypothetical protein